MGSGGASGGQFGFELVDRNHALVAILVQKKGDVPHHPPAGDEVLALEDGGGGVEFLGLAGFEAGQHQLALAGIIAQPDRIVALAGDEVLGEGGSRGESGGSGGGDNKGFHQILPVPSASSASGWGTDLCATRGMLRLARNLPCRRHDGARVRVCLFRYGKRDSR